MKISPKLGIIVNALLAGLGALLGGLTLFTTLFGEGTAQKIVAGISLASMFLGAVNGALHSYAAGAEPGPRAPVLPDEVKTAMLKAGLKSIVVLGLIFGLAGGFHRAVAAPVPPHRPKELPMARVLRKGPLINSLANWIGADIDGAIALSTSIPSLQDKVGQECFTTIKTVGLILKAHPLPLTLHAATDLEAARLAVAALHKICIDPNCAQMWNDAANAAQALSVVPMPLSFTSICAKVPVIGLTPVGTAVVPASVSHGAP